MGVKEYSVALDLNTKKSRLGCSVCRKKIKNDTSIEHSSSKPLMDKKHLINNVSDKKNKNCEFSKSTPTIILNPKLSECYCNHMEQTKIESLPKFICSKRFKTPQLTDVNKKWLNEIIEFRRQNWFDCHADSLIDGISVHNCIPPNIFDKHKLNCNHLNNSIPFSIDGNELGTENPFIYLKDTAAVKKHPNVQKKTTVSKFAGKKKKNPNAIYKPWIPPSSVH